MEENDIWKGHMVTDYLTTQFKYNSDDSKTQEIWIIEIQVVNILRSVWASGIGEMSISSEFASSI